MGYTKIVSPKFDSKYPRMTINKVDKILNFSEIFINMRFGLFLKDFHFLERFYEQIIKICIY